MSKFFSIKSYRNIAATFTLALLLVLSQNTFAVEGENGGEGEGKNSFENRGIRREELDQKMEERKQNIMEKREDIKERQIESRCSIRDKRLGNRINMLEKTHRFNVHRYERIRDRVQNLVDRLKEKDVDVAELEADLDTLETKINTLKEKHQDLIDSLTELKETPCDEETINDSFNSQVEGLKTILEEIKVAAKDIKDFIMTEIKADLADLRDELKLIRSSEPKPTKESSE